MLISLNPTKPKCMKAELSKPINKRSPRVVVIGRNPFRSTHGNLTSNTVMVIRIKPIPVKNSADGVVHAIQFIVFSLYATERESFSYVISNKPDNQYSWNDGEYTSGG